MSKSAVREVDKGWNALVATVRLYKRANTHVKVGFLDDGGKGSEDHGGLTTAQLAGVLEFGTDDGHIPARSFVGATFERNRDKYHGDLKLLLAKVYSGKLEIEKVFEIMGARMANDIKRYVTTGAGVPPPNAPSTIAQKGSARPLIDTARMIGALTWLVVSSVKR